MTAHGATVGSTQVVAYTYDAWGNPLTTTGTMADTLGNLNPFRYRGYVYDTETGLYYLQSRYYNPETGRFINADSCISGIGGDIEGYNLFAYCENNPVNMSDSSGNWPKILTTIAAAIKNTVAKIVTAVKSVFSTSRNVAKASSHDSNRRPNKGVPGTTYRAPNGDTRTYGPDGKPQRDYDHDDHGQPDKHPHDENGGHSHDWDWKNKQHPRGPAYAKSLDVLVGVGVVSICAIGIVIVAADDLTGIGIADDFLLAPLSTGLGQGLILIFG